MKLLLNVSNYKELDNLTDKIDGYILSSYNYSINYDYQVEDEKLESVVKYLKDNKKEVIININKNIHNDMIEELTEYLKFIDTLNIDFVIYHDLAILNIVKELKLDIPLIYGANMYITNYNIINFYKSEIEGVLLSSEILRDDIIKIRENTDSKLFYNVFGYLPMMFTKRNLIGNYLEYSNLDSNEGIHTLEDKISKNKYPIVKNNGITTIYEHKLVNVLKDSVCDYIDYGIVNLFNTNYDIEEIYSTDIETNINFLEKETIYKVGNKNEKN